MAWACSSDTTSPHSTSSATDATNLDGSELDSDSDASASSPLAPTPPVEGVSPDGHPDVRAELEDDEVRLGRIRGPGETGFEGIWSHCRIGDFKLYNAEIAVCIQNETTNRHAVFSGGKIVDARPVGYEGADTLDEVMPLVRLGTVRARSVRVVRDGSRGGPAVLRVEGRDVPVAQVFGVAGRGLGTGADVDVTLEYRLQPGSRSVEMLTWISGSNARRVQIGDWFGGGDRTRVWRPGEGFQTADAPFAWIGAIATTNREMSYGWVTSGEPASSVSLLAERVPWVAARTSSIEAPGDAGRLHRRWFVVGDGTLESIRRRARRLRSNPPEGAERQLRLVDASGDPVADRGVTFYRDQRPVTFGRTDDAGSIDVQLESGEWRLEIEPASGGATIERTLSWSEGRTDARVSVPTPGRLDWTIREADTKTPVTARIATRGEGREEWFARKGELDVPLAAGSYRVVVMRGPEYEAKRLDVAIEPGETDERTLDLERVLETEGWLSGDFHQHLEPSIDSAVHVRERVLENAAVGVEFVVPTDHDVVTDLNDTIRDLGLEDRLATVSGVEVSPLEAHFNLYPMPHHHDERGFGTVDLATFENGAPRKRTVPELIDRAHRLEHDPFVQLNHARDETSGLLELVDYDPERPPSAVAHPQSTFRFDTMEIVNGFDRVCRLFADWSGLLNAGYTPTGLGNSDTHGLGGQSGLPRNYLKTSSAPGEADAETLRRALNEMQVTVGAHAFVELTGEHQPGDRIASESGEVSFEVRVQTPGWSTIEHLVVVANGRVVDQIDRSEGRAARIVDIDRSIDVSLDRDGWVVFLAWGPPPSGPIRYGAPAMAFTNPVFVDLDGDADGDGDPWEAPGARSLSLGPITESSLCQ
jgi:hypothetical protein